MMHFASIKRNLIEILGTPYYANEHGVIFCMDSTKAHEKITKCFANLIITSPPYNIGKEYESMLSMDEYISWSEKWIRGAAKTLLPAGAMLLNLGYVNLEDRARAIPLPYLLWEKIPLYLNQEIVWNYTAGVACKNFLSPRNEKFLWYVKDREQYTFNLDAIRDKNIKYPNSRKNGRLRTNTLGKNPSDVWEIAKVTTGQGRSSKERTRHPCQFPLDLLERAVLGFSNENDVLYDPFIGSGSVFEACMRWNRRCVGIEIREDYCEIIKRRIEDMSVSKSLFNYSFA